MGLCFSKILNKKNNRKNLVTEIPKLIFRNLKKLIRKWSPVNFICRNYVRGGWVGWYLRDNVANILKINVGNNLIIFIIRLSANFYMDHPPQWRCLAVPPPFCLWQKRGWVPQKSFGFFQSFCLFFPFTLRLIFKLRTQPKLKSFAMQKTNNWALSIEHWELFSIIHLPF